MHSEKWRPTFIPLTISRSEPVPASSVPSATVLRPHNARCASSIVWASDGRDKLTRKCMGIPGVPRARCRTPAGFHDLQLTLNGIVPVQSTIDFYRNRKQRRAARSSGNAWVNPYDLGPAANWQVCRHPATRLRAFVRRCPAAEKLNAARCLTALIGCFTALMRVMGRSHRTVCKLLGVKPGWTSDSGETHPNQKPLIELPHVSIGAVQLQLLCRAFAVAGRL